MATSPNPTRNDFEALLNESLGGAEGGFEGRVVKGTVTAIENDFAMIDVGLKSLGMDHGNPHIEDATIWFVSDEHITFSMKNRELPSVGDKVRVTPAHIDPTMAMHEVAWAINGETIVDRWGVDLRGW